MQAPIRIARFPALSYCHHFVKVSPDWRGVMENRNKSDGSQFLGTPKTPFRQAHYLGPHQPRHKKTQEQQSLRPKKGPELEAGYFRYCVRVILILSWEKDKYNNRLFLYCEFLSFLQKLSWSRFKIRQAAFRIRHRSNHSELEVYKRNLPNIDRAQPCPLMKLAQVKSISYRVPFTNRTPVVNEMRRMQVFVSSK